MKPTKEMETLIDIQANDQLQKDSILPPLLYITRKLGELEGIISTQTAPNDLLSTVRDDFLRLQGRLIESAG